MKKIIELTFKVLNKTSLKFIERILFICLITIMVSLMILEFMNILNLLNLKFMNMIISSGLVVIFALTILLLLLFNFIMTSISDMTNYAKMISSGKINVNDIVIKGNNEFSILAEAINNFKSNLLFLLAQTRSNILVLSESIGRVSTSMDMVLAENEQVSGETQEIASKSQEQLNIVADTIAKTDEVKRSTDVINLNIKEIEGIASDANLYAKTGKENLNIYNENINLISGSMGGTHEFIAQLKKNVSDIGNVVSFIVGLSRQLKLLSLNASIQAEKAGEAGKSFAVVAQEITKLSDSTKEGIDKINIIITNILDGSGKVEDGIKQSIEYFENGKDVFSDVEKTFSSISEKNILLLNQISAVSSESSNINLNVNKTVSLCRDVKDSSVIVCQSTEEAVASIEEELGEFQEINSSMSELNSELVKIENLLTKFELDIKPVEENPADPLKIAIIIPKLGPVWDMIQFGASYAKKILKSKNTIVEMIPMNSFSEDEYCKILKNCIVDGYNGIITPGFFEKQLEYADKINIPIVTYNTDTKARNKRIAYVGENSYKSGIAAGKIMIKEISGNGKILIITSDSNYENFKLRVQGFKDSISSRKNIEIADVLEVPLGDEKVYEAAKEYLKRNSNIIGIINVTGGTLGLARAIDELHMSNKLKVIVFYDLIEKVIKYINKGTITCTIGQDPFRQGYDGLIYMYDYLVKGIKPEEEKTWTKAESMDINKAKHFLG